MPSSITAAGGEVRRSHTTVLTTTSVETVGGDLPDLSQRWNGDVTPDNIRLTAFGPKRTTYTYAESGGYRSDRLKDKWSAPNLSRAALGSLGFAFQRESDSGFTDRNEELVMQTRNRSGKDTRISETSVKRYTSSPIDQDDISRGRSMCKRFVGEWCLHSDCAVVLERSSDTNPTNELRTSSDTASLDRNRPSERLPASFESGDVGARVTRRRSSRLSRTPAGQATRNRQDSSSLGTTAHDAPPPLYSPSAGGTNISTYVYTMSQWPNNGDGPDSHFRPTRLPQPPSALTTQVKAIGEVASRLPSAPAEHKQGSWLTKSIFGLEKASAVRQGVSQRRRSTGPFISSDTEDHVDSCRRITRSQWSAQSHLPRPSHSYLIRLYKNTLGPIFSFFHETGRSLFNRCSHLSIQLLAFLLVFVYTCLGLLFQSGYWVFKKLQSWTAALTTRKQQRSFHSDYRGVGLHPRLSGFQSRSTSTYLTTEEREQQAVTERINNNNSSPSGIHCLTHYPWLLSRVAGVFFILLLLALLLLFLLAPIASDASQQDRWLAFVLPDANCLRSGIARPKAKDSGMWTAASWRARCLYQTYLARNMSTSDGASVANPGWSLSFGTFFSSLGRWFQSSGDGDHSDWSTVSQSFNLHVGQNNHTQLLKELVSFASAVNLRLDLVSKSIKSTNSELSSLAGRVDSTSDSLRSQVAGLQTSLSRQTDHWDRWHRDIQLAVAKLQATASTSSGTSAGQDGHQGLVQAVLSATNATITEQMALVHRQLQEEHSHLGRKTNATLLELSLLVTTLRQQMSSRMKQAEKEIGQLRFQLDNILSGQKTNETMMTATIDELHKTMQFLSGRLNRLEKANSDAERLVLTLSQDIQRCHHDHGVVTEHCQKTTMQYVDSAVARLSHKLSNDVSSMISETLARELPVHLVNSHFLTDLQTKVRQMTSEAVDQAVGKLKLSHSAVHLADGVDVQAMIETALNRFAADRTGMADFAMESAGGAVVGTRCTRTYTDGAAIFSLFGIPLARLTNSARTMIQPGNNPGDCWPFHGSTGHVIIRLATPVFISAVSLEHLPRELAPNGRLDSAPKEFAINGLTSESDEDGVELGRFVYDTDGSPIQTFYLSKSVDQPHQYVELHVLSNHGHPLYTCVYRLRVHGKMAQ